MDFQKLLQQASSNQKLAQRKYEKEHHAKVEQAHRQEKREREDKKKKAAMLKEAQERAFKANMRYHGIVESRVPAPKTAAKPSSNSSATSKPRPHKPEQKLAQPKSSAKADSLVKQKNKQVPLNGSKTKKTSSLASSQAKGKVEKHPVTNGLVAKSSHSRSASPRPSNRLATPNKNSTKKPVPASFNDLLKRAAQNKLAADPLAARTADARTRAQPSSYPRSASPVGKSLLDRTHQKARGGPLPPSKVKVTPPPPTSSMRESTKASKRDTSMSVGKSGATVGGRQAGRKTRKGSLISPSDLTRRPLKDPGKTAPSPSSHRKVDLSDRDKSLHLPIPGQGPRKVISMATSGPTHARPRQAMPPAKGRPSPRKGGRGGASASEFYGAATSRILGKDGSNNRSLGLGPYRSSWVDEMRDFIQSNELGPDDYYSDEDEEDDMDDFVASDDEEEDGGMADYSSEISKIFGYDRRKYRDIDDGVAMESSYAQQEYEESRSTRIGRAEDDEELAREKALQRKRKGTKKVPPVKKSKLGF